MTSIAERAPRLKWLIGIGLVNLATFTWATNMILGRWLQDSVSGQSV